MIPLLLALLSALSPSPSPAPGTSVAADDKFTAAQTKFVQAAVSDSLDERKAALDALVALADPAASAVIGAEYGKAAEELRTQREAAFKTRYALDRRQIVLENLKLEAQRDPSLKELFGREEEKIAALKKDLSKAERALALLDPWRDALGDGMAKLYEALGPARRRKSEQEVWQDAKEHPEVAVRMASVELLGRVGGPGTAAQLHDILVESDTLITKLQGRLDKAMGDVRKMEKRMQEELVANQGRMTQATAEQYDRTKQEASEAQTSIFRLELLVEASARAGGMALSRETGKDLDKTMTKLVGTLKKSKDRSRIDTLRLLTCAGGDEVKMRARALLAAESDPIGIATLIDGLAALGDKAIVADLLAKFVTHENWYVRARSAHALAALRSREAIPVLIARLGVEDGRLRTDVTQSLRSLTGQKFHSNATIWERWWKDNEAGFEVPPLAPEKSAVEEAKEASGVTFFGINTDSQRVLFVLDLSGSMAFSMKPKKNPDDDPNKPADLPGPGEMSRHEASKRDLIKALGGLKDGAVFNLVLFASDVWTWTDGLATMSPEVRTQVVTFIEKSDAIGGTNMYGALERALDLAGAKGGGVWTKPPIDTIYLLTDGRASVGVTTDPDQILAFVRERNATAGITIHTIGLSDAHDAVLLRRMAEENGGQYVGR